MDNFEDLDPEKVEKMVKKILKNALGNMHSYEVSVLEKASMDLFATMVSIDKLIYGLTAHAGYADIVRFKDDAMVIVPAFLGVLLATFCDEKEFYKQSKEAFDSALKEIPEKLEKHIKNINDFKEKIKKESH